MAKYPKILWIIYCQVAPGPLIWGYAAYPCSPRLCTCTLCVVSVCNWPTVPRPTVLPCLRLAKGLKTSDVAVNELGLQKAAHTIMPVVLTLDARYMAPVVYIQVRWEWLTVSAEERHELLDCGAVPLIRCDIVGWHVYMWFHICYSILMIKV